MDRAGSRHRFVQALAGRLPFHYGWVILAIACLAGFSRQGSAVATLSIFMAPMTGEFGWSRTAISAAVSVGGVLGAIVAPALGARMDRSGARTLLMAAVLLTGIPVLLLSATQSLAWFFTLYCVARMSFTGPYDLGISGSVMNWFYRRRALATSIVTLAHMVGLVAMPLIAHFVMQGTSWRGAWLAVGATVLLVGFLPVWLLHVRRPEDLGQHLEGAPRSAPGAVGATAVEPQYTRAQALATPAFWLLSLYTLLVFPIQAGFSLHQAPLLIERGLDPADAAGAVSTFALVSAVSGFAFGFWPRRVPLRYALALAALFLLASCVVMSQVHSAALGYAAAATFGMGLGSMLTILPLAWADYFGRASYGAIRGVALTVQVIAQASGPVLSGALRDVTGSYDASLVTFGLLGLAGAAVALAARPPSR